MKVVMTVFSRLFRRFRQFGGFRLIWEYIKLGAFSEFLRQGFAVVRKKRTITDAYSKIQAKVVPHIRMRYECLLLELIEKYSKSNRVNKKSNIVWVCWLQGMEEAPEIVTVCYASLQRYLKDKEIVVITQKNIGEYVTFPEHVQKKYDKGIIPMAQFTDLLRLELLSRYGGTWIDATVLCTGFDTQKTKDIKNCLNEDLFFFQYLMKDDGKFYGISSWFISACSDQKMLLILKDMLYQYWKEYDCVVAYFIFHIFFTMIAEQMPEEVKKMPKMNNRYSFFLEHCLSDDYDDKWMNELTSRCCFHKLNGRLWKEAEGKPNSFMYKIKELYH